MSCRKAWAAAILWCSLLFMCASCHTFPPFEGMFRSWERTLKGEEAVTGPPDEFFLRSDQLFREGKYRSALRVTRRTYKEASDPAVEEEGLFRVLLILSFGDNPNRNYAEAERVAKVFVQKYPESKRRMEAEAILLLLQEVSRSRAEVETLKGYNAIQEKKVQRLEEDLLKIKEIDLQLEEHKKTLE